MVADALLRERLRCARIVAILADELIQHLRASSHDHAADATVLFADTCEIQILCGAGIQPPSIEELAALLQPGNA